MLETTRPVTPPEHLHAFAPSAERIFFLDQRMRQRLADSLRHIWDRANGCLDVPPELFQKFLARLERHPVSPLAFNFYCDTVLALEDDDLARATGLLQELIHLPVSPGGTNISELGDLQKNATARRYANSINTDPTCKFEIFSPSPAVAQTCRAQIKGAFDLMDAGDPVLAAEIRALLREIVLAAGTSEKNTMTFDGASSFMLWGAIIINANRNDGELEMVQMLAHESAHNLLFGLSADEALVENSPEELFSSPLRKDPRPMDGIYHATFVTARMHRSIQCLVESGTLSVPFKEKALQELETDTRLFKQGIETVRQYGKLSPLGAEIMQGASDYMAAFV
jgi:hypothetical protein